MKKKAKYLTQMTGVDTLLVAGGAGFTPSEAQLGHCAYGERANCHLLYPEGRSGAVPLHPSEMNLDPLDAWIGDISRHAQIVTPVLV